MQVSRSTLSLSAAAAAEHGVRPRRVSAMRDRNRMSRVLLALSTALSAAVAYASVPARGDTKDEDELSGEWTLVRHVKPDGTVISHRDVIGNSHFLLRFGGGRAVEEKAVQEYDYGDPSLEITWALALASSATSKRIDLTGADASSSAVATELKGKVRRGIYRIDGDRLILCLAEFDAKARPSAFEPGRGWDVYELKRVKK